MEQRIEYDFFAVKTNTAIIGEIFMEAMQQKQTRHNSNAAFHFKRARLDEIFSKAIKYPLVMVCAGAGYGKTCAVHDFVQEYQATTVWVQLSERDNVGARFWENFIHTVMQINPPFAKAMNKLGFPDTTEKLNQYYTLLRDYIYKKRRVIVFDDFHFIENPAVIRFIEESYQHMPAGSTLFLISRSTPRVNIAGLVSSDQIFNINEEELRFSENELAQYFRRQGFSLSPDNLRGIMQDTEGWAFAINLIARSYEKAPGYEGYLRNAMKTNIFRYMETEIWDSISKRLQSFLAKLSMIDHLSVDLIALLAGEDKDLPAELERQNAYIRRDSYINAYLIHPLFLEFLSAKQELLTKEQKKETYTIAGTWCDKNGFKIDALSYYEKNKDYKSIVGMFIGSPAQTPYDVARYTAAIMERAPQEAFDTVVYLASTHLRSLMCQGLWREAYKTAEQYEQRFLKLPKDDPFRKSSLGSLYYCWAVTRCALCFEEDVYDFDLYYEKLDKLYCEPINPEKILAPFIGPWVCCVGSSRKGAVEEFIGALERAVAFMSHCFNGFESGEDDLAHGELKFYQSDAPAAQPYIARAIDRAKDKKQTVIVHKALFYTLRLAIMQGNYAKVEQTLKEMNALLDDSNYSNRFVERDICRCWCYCAIGLPEKSPDWLKDNFSPYAHAGFIENYANQMKARYCYATRNYPPLLSYINDMKKRESYLFGRVELLAIEACVHYKMKNKEKAYAALEEAYNTAAPNDIQMPFIELGKDMRTLASFALKKSGGSIPKQWLESINRKAASYAKRLAHVVSEYKQVNNITDGVYISPRETDILTDLSHGLSRTEIAASRSLSINTVKMVINNVYMKLGAENLADAIRIAAEKKIV
jgi:LuxR family maltose regulon positive regulatory protein